MNLVFLDIETTGLIPENADLIELSAVRVENGKIGRKFDSLVQPFREIPPEIEKLTNIKNENVKDAPILSKVRTDFIERYLQVDDILVAHNSAFDIGFLNHKEFDLEYPEIDTFDLASLLLPDEGSLSLEVLANKFDISHENAHRAMSDVLATVGVWKKMQEIVKKEWSKETFDEVLKILKKSEWPGKVFFEELIPIFEKQEEEKQFSLFDLNEIKSEEIIFTQEEEDLAELLSREIAPSTKKALEIPSSASQTNVAYLASKKSSEKIIITSKKNPDLPIFDAEENFLCSSRLAEFKQKQSFDKIETLTLLKIIIYKGVHISELNLKGEENNIFYKYLSTKNHEECPDDCPAKKAISKAKNSRVVFVPLNNLEFYEGGNLIICHADTLDETLTNIKTIRSFSISFEKLGKRIKNKAQAEFFDGLLFGFGLIARYTRERTQESIYPESLKITVKDEYSEEFKNFADGFLEAEREFQNIFPEENYLIGEIKKWQEFFALKAPENHIKTLIVYPDNSIAFSVSPIELKNDLEKIMFNKDSVLFLGNNFAKHPENGLLSFPFNEEKIEFKSIKNKFDFANNALFIAPSDSQNGSEKNAEEVARQIIDLYELNQGNVLVVLASQNMLKNIEDILSEKKLPVFAPLMGSLQKTASMFSAGNGNKILLSSLKQTKKLIKNISEPFKIFYLQKFAFDPPNNPLLEERQNLFDNAFMEFALPRAIQNFLKIFYLSVSKTSKFVFFCADPKIIQQNSWGRHFFNALPEELPKKFLDQEKTKEMINQFFSE